MKHNISNIDPETMTGDCSACGPSISLKKRDAKSFRCRNKHNETQQRYDWKRNAIRGGYNAAEYDPTERVRRLEEQNGGCAICKTHITLLSGRLDHDHVTGHTRGMLCNRCNMAIGFFNDDAELLASAAKYLGGTEVIDTPQRGW